MKSGRKHGARGAKLSASRRTKRAKSDSSPRLKASAKSKSSLSSSARSQRSEQTEPKRKSMALSETLNPPTAQLGPDSSAGPAALETSDPNFTAASRDRSDANSDAAYPRMQTHPGQEQRLDNSDKTRPTRKAPTDASVRDLMTRDVAVCTPDTQLAHVARMMEERDCGALPVVESTDSMRPIGIVTDRDIVIRALAKNQNALSLCAGDVMSSDLLCVNPDMSLEDCVHGMEDRSIRRAIVVDHTGRCCGIIAQADIALWSGSEASDLVRHVSESEPQISPQQYH
jgi:CBS domain-containing protein